MKNRSQHIAFRACLNFTLLIILISLGVSQASFAQAPTIKTIEKSFSAKEQVKISHRYGPLTVLPATDGKVSITGKLYAQAANAEDLETLKRYFEFEVVESSNNLEVLTHFKVKNWNSRNGVIKLEFQDGTRINKIKNLKIECTIYAPTSSKLTLSNKYDEIRIVEGTSNDLAIDIYSGRLRLGNIGGRLEIKSKYSKGEVGNFGDADLDLYDCDLTFGNGQSVVLKSKYSELEMGNFSELNADTYDDNMEWGNIQGKLTLQDKYSEFKIGTFNTARMDIYDANMVSDGGSELLVKSKYSEFRFKEIGQLSFENSYDDDVEVERVGSFSSISKYTEYDFDQLKSKLYLRSHDDDLRVGQIVGPLEGIDFEGKYTDLYLRLPNSTDFQLDANLTYGNLKYPEDRFESQYYKEKNDRMEVRGKTKGASDSSPKISIIAYDGKITIE